MIHDRGLWIGLALGAPVMAVGVVGAVRSSAGLEPVDLARWMIGSAVVHDLVLVPVVLAVGTLARRLVPRWAWPVVRWALLTTGALALFAWPYVRGYGRNPNVPSLLPRNYGLGLLAYMAAVWLLAGALLVAIGAARRGRRRGAAHSGRRGPAPPSASP